MRKAKFRQLLNIFHMMSAAFLAPAFALIAITGGLHSQLPRESRLRRNLGENLLGKPRKPSTLYFGK